MWDGRLNERAFGVTDMNLLKVILLIYEDAIK